MRIATSRKIKIVFICCIAMSLMLTACSAEKKKPVSLTSKEIAKKVGPDVVFLSNDYSTGSGILLDDGYILTNQHVIDGLETIDVTFENGDEHKKVKIYSQDVELDLALVGPVKEKGSLNFGATTSLGKGDEIYLIGYPEETDEKPDTTITKGILSRVRKSKDKKTSFLQTDASISSGQSGGAMVDLNGDVVGVSGLGDDSFAYALSSENIQTSIKAMKKKPVKPYDPYPVSENDKRGKKEHDITITPRYGVQTFMAYVKDETTVTLSFPRNKIPALDVSDFVGNMEYLSNQESLDQQEKLYAASPDELEEFEGEFSEDANLKEKSPGVYSIEVPEDTILIIDIGSNNVEADGFTTQMTSSIPLIYHEIRYPLQDLPLGKKLLGEIDSLENANFYAVDLEKDQKYTVSVRSRVGDMVYLVVPSDRLPEDLEPIDDAESDGGIFGFDAVGEYKPTQTGKYYVVVPTSFGYSTAYTIEVKKGGLKKS